jgi:hypothetical protein
MVLYLISIFDGKKHSIMKNIKYFILGYWSIQGGASAQLKA